MKQDVRAKGRPLIAAAYGVSNVAITAETGPVTSLRGIMAGLDGDFAFAVLARPCFGLPHRADVGSGLKGLRNWLCQNEYDLLYLNSFFDREYTLPILALRRARPYSAPSNRHRSARRIFSRRVEFQIGQEARIY